MADSQEIRCSTCGRKAYVQDGLVLTHGVLGEEFCPASDRRADLQAREIAATLTPEAIHCIRKVVQGEQFHAQRKRPAGDPVREWAMGGPTHGVDHRAFASVKAAGLIGWDNGSVLTDDGRAVAAVLAGEAVSHG
jgi:hypothetical protein